MSSNKNIGLNSSRYVAIFMGLNIPLFSGHSLLPFPALLTPLPLKKKNAVSGTVDCKGTDTDRLLHRLRTSRVQYALVVP